MRKLIDIAGQKFGRLTVVAHLGSGRWECLCSCGRSTTCLGVDLRNGHRTSCGCKRHEPKIFTPDSIQKIRAAKLGKSNPNWKGGKATPNAGRSRARTKFAALNCSRCGALKAERHHKDGDTNNNDESNIDIVCRRCHMVVDGRLAGLVARNRGLTA